MFKKKKSKIKLDVSNVSSEQKNFFKIEKINPERITFIKEPLGYRVLLDNNQILRMENVNKAYSSDWDWNNTSLEKQISVCMSIIMKLFDVEDSKEKSDFFRNFDDSFRDLNFSKNEKKLLFHSQGEFVVELDLDWIFGSRWTWDKQISFEEQLFVSLRIALLFSKEKSLSLNSIKSLNYEND